MPIEGYDQLSVKQILPRLAGLSGPELKAVSAHEKQGKNRVTLLRGVHQIELARAAAARRAPAPHLTVVEAATEPTADFAEIADIDAIEAIEAVDDFEAIDEIDTFGEVDEVDQDEESMSSEGPEALDDERFDDEKLDEELRPVAAATAAPEVILTKAAAPVVAKKKSRSRPAVKHATWEEELRPQLPKRLETTAFEYEYEPPVVGMVPPIEAIPSDASTPTPRITGPAKVRRRFEGMALVMAAILAVLLGLAIGTVLARTGGGTTAQPVSASVAVSEAASVQSGG